MSTCRLGWLLVPFLLGACGDPFDRQGTWQPVGINQANFDTEVAGKADTVAGHGTSGSDAVLDAAAVLRLYEDKAKPLRNESTTSGTGSQ